MTESTLTLLPAALDWLILNTSDLGIAAGGVPARVVYAGLAALSTLLWRLRPRRLKPARRCYTGKASRIAIHASAMNF